MTSQKGVAHLLVMLGVVAVLSLLAFRLDKVFLGVIVPPASPSPQKEVTSPPKDKIYRDQNLGFELSYPPSGFSVVPDNEELYFKHNQADFRKNFQGYVGYPPPKFVGGIILSPEGHPEQFNLAPLTLWVFDNPNNLTINQWYQRYWYYPFVWGQFAEPQKGAIAPNQESSVSGKLAQYGVVPYQPGSPKFIYLAWGDKMFLFRVVDTKESSLGSQLVNSFKLRK